MHDGFEPLSNHMRRHVNVHVEAVDGHTTVATLAVRVMMGKLEWSTVPFQSHGPQRDVENRASHVLTAGRCITKERPASKRSKVDRQPPIPVERTSSRAGVASAEVQRLSRRTLSTTIANESGFPLQERVPESFIIWDSVHRCVECFNP
jgi:hypothetical protein